MRSIHYERVTGGAWQSACHRPSLRRYRQGVRAKQPDLVTICPSKSRMFRQAQAGVAMKASGDCTDASKQHRYRAVAAIGFADFRRNKQFISTGTLRTDDRVALIMVDNPRQTRLKILALAPFERYLSGYSTKKVQKETSHEGSRIHRDFTPLSFRNGRPFRSSYAARPWPRVRNGGDCSNNDQCRGQRYDRYPASPPQYSGS